MKQTYIDNRFFFKTNVLKVLFILRLLFYNELDSGKPNRLILDYNRRALGEQTVNYTVLLLDIVEHVTRNW